MRAQRFHLRDPSMDRSLEGPSSRASPSVARQQASACGVPALARGHRPAAWTDLSGTEFDLRIGETPTNFTGNPRVAFTVNGSVPAPTLRWKEGDTVTLRVANTLDEDASIHWHGILLPANMDGVPGLSFHGIRPGETCMYRFTVRQAGTYWSPQSFGISGTAWRVWPTRHRASGPRAVPADREHVVMLTDWTDENPERVFAKLKKRSDYYNFQQRTVGDFFRDVRSDGTQERARRPQDVGRDAMNPTDLADVSGYTYTYSDGVTPPAIGRHSSNPANECGCASSMARRCRISTCEFPA